MKTQCVRIAVFCGALGVCASFASAQRVATVATNSPVTHVVAYAEVLDRPVTVALDNVSLETAIQTIAERANVRVSYRMALLERVAKPVSVQLNNVKLRLALERVLAGTSLYAVASGKDVLSIREAEQVVAAVQGVITGKVTHAKTKQPIVGARVMLDDGRTQVVTGNEGIFRLQASAGEQTVQVRAVGFVRRSMTVQVADNEAVTVDVALEPSASVLDEVVVTGTVVATQRKAIPTPITVITGEELERRGVTRVDQLFRGDIPGLIALESGSQRYGNSRLGNLTSSEVYARGASDVFGNTNPLKTYVDGVELLDASALGTIDPKSIERIEVITGPQAATIYGSGAMGGVMQIFTKQGNGTASRDITLTLKYGVLQSNFSNGYTPSHNDAVNVTGGIGPALSYTASASYVYTGQWQPKLFSRTYGMSAGASHAGDRVRASASLSMTNSKNGTWTNFGFSSQYGYLKNLEGGDFVMSAGSNDRLAFISQQRSTTSTQNAAFNLDYQHSDTWQHHVTLGRNQNQLALTPVAPSFADRTLVGADSLYRTSSGNGQRTTASYNTTLLSSFRGITSTATVGGNSTFGTSQNVQGCQVSDIATTTIGCTGATSLPRVNTTLDDKSWGGFASWQIGILNQAYLTLGLRGEHNPTYGRSHTIDWTPTSGLTYTVERGDLTVKLLGSYGRATRPPPEGYRREVLQRTNGYVDVFEYVARLEAPNLRPERSTGPQGGIEIYYGNLGSITVNHYSQKVVDLIQIVNVDSFAGVQAWDNQESWIRQQQYQNTGTVRQFGWEGTGSLNLGYVQLKGTYFWNDSRILKANGIPPRTFTGVPTHAGNMTVGFAHGPTSVTLYSNYIGKTWNTWTQDGSLAFGEFYQRLKVYAGNQSQLILITIPVLHDAYVKSDLAISHRINNRVSLTANVTNLGNSFASETGSLNPALGRQSLFGITIR